MSSKVLSPSSDLLSDILSKPINLTDLLSSKIITSSESSLVNDFISESIEERNIYIKESGSLLIEIFNKILVAEINEVDIKYIISLMYDILYNNETSIKYFSNNIVLFDTLFRLLERYTNNLYLVAKISNILSLLLTSYCKTNNTIKLPIVKKLVDWIMCQIIANNSKTLLSAVSALKQLLKLTSLHEVAFPHSHEKIVLASASEGFLGSQQDSDRVVLEANLAASKNLTILANLLGVPGQNTQILYEVGFCLWLLSYNTDMHVQFHQSRVVKLVVGVIKTLLRAKVVRIALATLRNLLDKQKFNSEMIDADLPRLFPIMYARLEQWADEEMTDDLKNIDSRLSNEIKDLSSFEMHEKEVASGLLAWGILHTEKFWRENFMKFEKETFKSIRALISLLNSDDDTTLAIACYDLGEFARFHPNGKKIIQNHEGKSRLMSKMASKNPEVCKHSLLAVQKLMVTNWEFLAK